MAVATRVSFLLGKFDGYLVLIRLAGEAVSDLHVYPSEKDSGLHGTDGQVAA